MLTYRKSDVFCQAEMPVKLKVFIGQFMKLRCLLLFILNIIYETIIDVHYMMLNSQLCSFTVPLLLTASIS